MPRCFCQIYTHNNLTLSPLEVNLDEHIKKIYNKNRQKT